MFNDRILAKIILNIPIINGGGGRRIVLLKTTKHIKGIISTILNISHIDKYIGKPSLKIEVRKGEYKDNIANKNDII